MGRTNPTYRDALQAVEEEWKPFRRGLRHQYQADFDRLFERANDHAAAAGYANPEDPRWGLVLSILLSQEHELQQLREEVRQGP